MTEWISVEDKMPGLKIQDVIVWLGNHRNPYPSLARWTAVDDDGNFKFVKFEKPVDQYSPVIFKEVTHWMQLPAPPPSD